MDTWGHAPALDMTRTPNGAGTEGSPLLAPADGVVNQSYYHDNAGHLIQVNHGGSWFTTYIHLKSRSVPVGRQVRKGELIGYVGATGPSSNGVPHLHFEQAVDTNGDGRASWGAPGTERVRPVFNGIEHGARNGETTILRSMNCARQGVPRFFVAGADFRFGNPGDVPFAGDWNGDGRDDVGVYRPDNRTFYFHPTSGGTARPPITLGNPGDVPLAGDWNGDGQDDIGVYRPANRTFHFHPTTGGTAPAATTLGNPGDWPLVGDWNGDGRDDIGVYRPANRTFYFHPTSGGTARPPITLGNPGDWPLTGDWNNDGRDDIGVYRPGSRTFHFHPTSGGTAPAAVTLGNSGDWPLVGTWSGTTTPAVVR